MVPQWVQPKWVIALIFGVLALLNLCSIHKVDWTTIILVILAVSFWLVPMLAENIEELTLTAKGITWKSHYRNAVAQEVGAAQGMPNTLPTFSDLWPETRKVLKTLFHFQRQFNPNNDQSRWGFVTGVGSAFWNNGVAVPAICATPLGVACVSKALGIPRVF